MSLRLLKNKYIRYWLVDSKDDVCSFGYLLDYDNFGVLISCAERKTLDGAEFYPWSRIQTIGYFKSDLDNE